MGDLLWDWLQSSDTNEINHCKWITLKGKWALTIFVQVKFSNWKYSWLSDIIREHVHPHLEISYKCTWVIIFRPVPSVADNLNKQYWVAANKSKFKHTMLHLNQSFVHLGRKWGKTLRVIDSFHPYTVFILPVRIPEWWADLNPIWPSHSSQRRKCKTNYFLGFPAPGQIHPQRSCITLCCRYGVTYTHQTIYKGFGEESSFSFIRLFCNWNKRLQSPLWGQAESHLWVGKK